MKKSLCIVLILVVATVVHVIIRHRQVELEPLDYQESYDVVVEERIESQIKFLKTLTPRETVLHLKKLEYYAWPGAFIGAGEMFFFSDDGRYKVDDIGLKKILSNRVVRKCFQELQKLPKKEAAKIVNDELSQALGAYRKLYDVFFETRSLYFSRGEAPDGKPVLLGFRNDILALTLIAGSLGLTDCHEAICKIVDVAQNQKERIEQLEDVQLKFTYLTGASLYNPVILASGLYGTDSQKEVDVLKPYQVRYVPHRFVDFSAPATEFDVLVRDGVQQPVPDKEYINIQYFEQATDDDLKNLSRLGAVENK